jgi:hypothetical protein
MDVDVVGAVGAGAAAVVGTEGIVVVVEVPDPEQPVPRIVMATSPPIHRYRMGNITRPRR